MQTFKGAAFTAEAAWRGPNIAEIPDALVKLRWTDQPFEWHANTGEEVFVVLGGIVDMHVRGPDRAERVIVLEPGDILHIQKGEEHVAHPRGGAQILVVEGRDEA
ncbi:cupin domain-containing protein [Phenylobacterium soli]|uniref:Cupin n=1 Tax=Phenylobacterium soli TaxID=2170551 RepID=A0A328AGP8_9CAUL|nr:cupin domain-containing protein [Phenylobacterium soli]RAK54043.1 cupin [Phenylobacterium soli]